MDESANEPSTPDLIVHSAQVISTSDAPGAQIAVDTCQAFAVSAGLILARGSNDEILALRHPSTRVIDAGGKTILPGFIETHVHLAHYGANLLELDCRPSSTSAVSEIQTALAEEVAGASNGTWVLGWGWDESRMADGIGPTRWDLDAVAPDHPVFLRRTCAHMAVLNSRALELSGIDADTPDPEGGRIVRDASGQPSGLVQESALNLVSLPKKSPSDLSHGVRLAQEQFLARGITTIHDMATQEMDLEALEQLQTDGELVIRVRPWLWALDGNGFTGMLSAAVERGLRSGTGGDQVRIQGMKFMLDGSVGGRTAAVAEPFEGSQDTGILIHTADAVTPSVIKALSHGLRTAIHGIGDRAVGTAVDAYRRAAGQIAELAHMRNRIEHCALPSPQDLDDMHRLGIVAASSVGFLHELGDSYLANLGRDRMARVYPQRDFAEHSIIAPPNSDCPVTDADPWPIIDAAVNRRTLSGEVLDTVQNISVARAIDGYTRQAAMASFEEDRLGSMVTGSVADFIVVDADPFSSLIDLRTISVEETFVAGERVFSRHDR